MKLRTSIIFLKRGSSYKHQCMTQHRHKLNNIALIYCNQFLRVVNPEIVPIPRPEETYSARVGVSVCE